MGVSVSNITVDTEDILLVFVPPNWRFPFNATWVMRTEITETETGIEHRRSKDAFTMPNISYKTLLLEEEWQTLRDLEGQVGERRVGIPLWDDVLTYDTWITRKYSPRLIVAWDGDFKDPVVVSADDELPLKDHIAPLVIGYISVSTSMLTDDKAEATITLEGDHPFKWRIDSITEVADYGYVLTSPPAAPPTAYPGESVEAPDDDYGSIDMPAGEDTDDGYLQRPESDTWNLDRAPDREELKNSFP